MHEPHSASPAAARGMRGLVAIVLVLAGAIAGSAPAQCGDPLAGPCCSPKPTTGCEDLLCCEAVCAIDPGCCLITWDSTCAAIASEVCTLCTSLVLAAPQPLQANSCQGMAVDVSPHRDGDFSPIAVGGAYLRDAPGPPVVADAGSISIMRRIGGQWLQQAVFYPTPTIGATYFGRSVAAFKGPTVDVAVAGAYRDSQQGTQRGAVSVFTAVPGSATWSAEAVLRPGTGAVNNEWFGFSLDGVHLVDSAKDTLFIGAPRAGVSQRGAVYIFERAVGGTWALAVKVATPSSASYNGSQFGWSVASPGEVRTGENDQPLATPHKLLVIGAPAFNGERGRIFVCERRATDTWLNSTQRTLFLSNSTAGDRYGESVAAASRFIAVGAPGRNDGAGVVQIWERTKTGTSNYRSRLILAPSSDLPDQQFGSSVSMTEWDDGSVLLAVGARGDGTLAVNAGAIYLYRWQPGTSPELWEFLGKKFATFAQTGDQFGFAVAAGDVATLVGAPFSNSPQPSGPTLNNTGSITEIFP